MNLENVIKIDYGSKKKAYARSFYLKGGKGKGQKLNI
jgi:hypothetical protein